MSSLYSVGGINNFLWYNMVWGGVFENTINHLQIFQNQIIRLLLNKDRI